ncbi:hypothetical protein BU23DRAFT_584079 [Bimuria novae-zelandiae CBS 107.79]|uniref:Cytochrome b5 reductase-like protein n=1 Tax=Bimuria novae-zelandiae CBS 107.79 TaxID=1447943 RepID=A0A6A5UQ46_9PLEO|nr:hypothetical protein BU23DRAFT_584079 [Bimuria novae-zelandiae CBS 107.79]
MPESNIFSAAEIASHATKDDCWIEIRGKVYNVTDYVRDHPGGIDVLIDTAGKDGTEAYDDVGHSEDADEILQSYLIGVAAESKKARKSKAVKLVQESSPLSKTAPTSSSSANVPKGVLASVAVAAPAYYAFQIPHSSFLKGFAIASVLSSIAFFAVGKELARFTHVEEGFGRYPPYRAQRRIAPANPHFAKGFLDAKEYKPLKVSKITKLSPNVYKYTFALPLPKDVIGLPMGQHISIKATIDGKAVILSYTPTSNNLDAGVLDVVIKIYPDGTLTGKYFAGLKVGDEVLLRGPKGALKYAAGHCKHIGMIADDIILRSELERYARQYPKYFKLWLMLDSPPVGWKGGSGFVTSEVMKERMPAPGPDTKIMLCGPPMMVGAAKKGLVSLGFKEPAAVGKMADEIFCF